MSYAIDAYRQLRPMTCVVPLLCVLCPTMLFAPLEQNHYKINKIDINIYKNNINIIKYIYFIIKSYAFIYGFMRTHDLGQHKLYASFTRMSTYSPFSLSRMILNSARPVSWKKSMSKPRQIMKQAKSVMRSSFVRLSLISPLYITLTCMDVSGLMDRLQVRCFFFCHSTRGTRSNNSRKQKAK